MLEAALDLLLEKQARARGQVERPRAPVPTIAGEVANQGAGQPAAGPVLKRLAAIASEGPGVAGIGLPARP